MPATVRVFRAHRPRRLRSKACDERHRALVLEGDLADVGDRASNQSCAVAPRLGAARSRGAIRRGDLDDTPARRLQGCAVGRACRDAHEDKSGIRSSRNRISERPRAGSEAFCRAVSKQAGGMRWAQSHKPALQVYHVVSQNRMLVSQIQTSVITVINWII